MKLSENLGTLFLAIWLIITSIVSLTAIHISLLSNIIPLFALIAGLLLVVGSVKLTKSLGIILLSIWLILRGLAPFIYVNIPYFGFILDLLAIAAGILILLRR